MNNVCMNCDCMDYICNLPDKSFELAIVDPPYGGGASETWSEKTRSRFGGRFDKYEIKATRTGGTWAGKYGTIIRHWDIAPPPEYFTQLFRISKNQIIFGGNYFDLPPTRCFIVWRKINIPATGFTLAPVEYAWASFIENAAYCEFVSCGNASEPRTHPTQKPVDLYKWLLARFAKTGDKILDTHVGSGSIRIACRDMGFDFTGCELDSNYFAAQEKRFRSYCQQQELFSFDGGNIIDG